MQDSLTKAPLLYFSSSEEGVLVAVNEKLCACLGYEREELINRKIDTIFTIATRIFHQTHFFPLLKMQQHAEEIYITLRAKNGEEVPVLINAEQQAAGESLQYVFAGVIVRNRKKFEDELVASKKAAETALLENTALVQAKQALEKHAELLDQQLQLIEVQNEELRQFNRVVTHDMQEPLRKLGVFTSMLVEDSEGIDTKKAVEKIRRVMEQMSGILSGLQQYIWLHDAPLRVEELDVSELLSAAATQVRQEFPEVTLSIQTGELQPFEGDRSQMLLLFRQLLANAVRFRQEEQQTAFVQVATISLQRNRFQNIEGKYRYEDWIRLEFKDQGVGFAGVYGEQALELFRRLHKQSGRGIGLSLCKKVVDNHQGSITLSSQVDKGTMVTILLPKAVGSKAIDISHNQKQPFVLK